MDDLLAELRAAIAAETEHAVELRRNLHRRPELAFAEYETTAAIAAALSEAGLEPVVRTAAVGLHVDVGTDGPMIGFRADIDALPILEASGSPFSSEIPGTMHACGHDAHTAIAVGLARTLHHMQLPGRVRFIFQPAEETVPSGAPDLVAEGVLDGVESIIAFHVDPSIPAGTVGLRTGAITAASDRIRIELTGPGGHTSRPHLTTDLIHAAAVVVTDLPQLVRRSIDPRKPFALVFGRIAGGEAENVIPALVEISGTLRIFDADLWRDMPQRVEQLVSEIVAPLGAAAKVTYERGAPPVVNDDAVSVILERTAAEVLGSEGIIASEQSMGAEDFAWYLEEIPGALIRLGAAPGGRAVGLHSATFDLDETAIPVGMMVGGAAIFALLEAAL
jgi:amidohydrolase